MKFKDKVIYDSNSGILCDVETGLKLPWYTPSFLIEFVKRDFKGKRIFEWGCGNSTIWYKAQGAIVEGVDSNKEWAELAGENIKVETEKQKYIGYINNFDKFDIIVIDGDPVSYRDDCFHPALRHIEDDGIIIIDNWEQPAVELSKWPETKKHIMRNELILTVYSWPIAGWQTALISKKDAYVNTIV